MDPIKVSKALEKAGFGDYFTPPSLTSMLLFTDRMLFLNESLNLTRWTQEDDVINFHLLDCANALPVMKTLMSSSVSPRVLDLGTGCGFPGVVFASAFPAWKVTFMDSTAKKVRAVQECLDGAKIPASTLCARAEDLGRNPMFRETWDGVLARAVADFPVALEFSLPLLKTGGYFVDWITADQLKKVDKAQKALDLLGGKVIKMLEYSIQSGSQSHWLLIVEKLGKTPISYPRPAGKPNKHPL
jgi:16S rRNA (guanine527-N7)-methyltransferase